MVRPTDKQVVFNDGGVAAGSASFTWNKATTVRLLTDKEWLWLTDKHIVSRAAAEAVQREFARVNGLTLAPRRDDYWLHVRGCDCAYCTWEREGVAAPSQDVRVYLHYIDSANWLRVRIRWQQGEPPTMTVEGAGTYADAPDPHDSTGAMAAAWFGTPGAGAAVDRVFGTVRARALLSDGDAGAEAVRALGVAGTLKGASGCEPAPKPEVCPSFEQCGNPRTCHSTQECIEFQQRTRGVKENLK